MAFIKTKNGHYIDKSNGELYNIHNILQDCQCLWTCKINTTIFMNCYAQFAYTLAKHTDKLFREKPHTHIYAIIYE